MTRYTLTKLSNDDLASIYGGQKIYCAFDPENNKTRYFVTDSTGFFTTYNRTVAINNSPLGWEVKFANCTDLEDAERLAREEVERLHLPLASSSTD